MCGSYGNILVHFYFDFNDFFRLLGEKRARASYGNILVHFYFNFNDFFRLLGETRACVVAMVTS